MGTLPPTPNLGLVLPNPGTLQPFSTATQNGWMQTIDTAIGADRGRLTALEADTGWSVAPFTALAGWTAPDRLGIRKVGKLVICSVEIKRTGGAITADASGNIADTAVASIDPAFSLGVPGAIMHSLPYTKAGVAMGAWRLTTGTPVELQLETLHTGNSINTNDTIRLYGVWFTP